MNQHRLKLSGPDSETLATLSVGTDCDLRCEFDHGTLTASGFDYFEALAELRFQLEVHNLRLHCNGASLDVYPSAMARQMGEGMLAYRLRKGRHSAQEDLVDIFEVGHWVIPSTVKEQKAYYEAWCSSNRR